MKTKSSLAMRWAHGLGFACLAGIAGPVIAQNSVTVYGVLNPGITAFDNVAGNHDYVMSDGVVQPSRLGFRGIEELGAGLSSVFQLEAGFSTKNGTLGQGGALFGRQAYLGLSSKSLGTLTLGRQYTFLYDDFVLMSNGVNTYNVYAFKMGDADGIAGQRMINSVKYVSSSFYGFQLGLMHGLGEVPGSVTKQSADSASLIYTASDFKLAAAFSAQRDSRPALSIGVDVFGQSVSQTTFDKITTAGVGAQARVGQTNLHAIVSTADYELAGRSSLLKMVEIGADRPLTANLSAGIGYAYYYIEGAHFNQISVGLDYVLSKRTDLSISYGAVQGSEGTHPQLYAAPAPSTSRMQQAASLGIRHKF